MRRVVITGGVLIAVAVVVVAAQPPVAPPLAPPVPPGPGTGAPVLPPAPPSTPMIGGPVLPAPPLGDNGPPLSKFDPLAAFPPITQFAVSGAIRGATWMGKMHQSHGRFLHGYNPALRQPMPGDHDLKQTQCALAMAQAAKFSGDKQQAVQARQTILVLLASAPVSQTDTTIRTPVQVSLVCNRVGFAAILAMAIYELPGADEQLLTDAERLCEFLRRQLRTDGSVHYTDGANDVPTQADPAGLNEYPGLALQALAVSNRQRPAEWKKDAVKRGVSHYAGLFRTRPHPLLAASLTPAATELYLQTKFPEMASAVFEMNDWLCAIQIASTDPRTPQWAGGFRTVVNGQATADPPGAAETGMYVQSLACAYQLSRATADLTREGKYRPTLGAAVEFLCGSQFSEANTRHFENTFRANMLIGGFHLSSTDGHLRTDATACAVTGLLRFLSSGAEGR